MGTLCVAHITVSAGRLSLVSIYSVDPRGLISPGNKTRLKVGGRGGGQNLKKWKVTSIAVICMKNG